MMGTGSARGRPTLSSITGGSGATSREKQCSRGTGGLDTSPATRGNALELLCPPPWHPAPQPASAAEGLSAQQGHRRHRSGCPSLGLAPLPAVPTGQSKHPQQSPPAPTPVLQTPGPHPANIPPGRSNTTTGTTGPQPRPHRARGSHKPPKPASPSRGELGMEPNWPLDHQPLPLP